MRKENKNESSGLSGLVFTLSLFAFVATILMAVFPVVVGILIVFYCLVALLLTIFTFGSIWSSDNFFKQLWSKIINLFSFSGETFNLAIYPLILFFVLAILSIVLNILSLNKKKGAKPRLIVSIVLLAISVITFVVILIVKGSLK